MRIEGWEKKLNDYIEAQKEKPFRWGSNDCVLFAGRAVNLQLGGKFKKVIASFSGYNMKESAKIIKDHGGSISGIIDKHLKRHDSPLQAKRGDIATVLINGDEAAGVVDMSGRNVACKARKGITFVSTANIIACWDIESEAECQP